MVLPNVGMVILATLSSLSPTAKLKEKLAHYADEPHFQGIPPHVKYHSGWKSWRVDLAGTFHRFKSKEEHC